MIQTAYPGTIDGTIRIPASKSHTIRALLISTFAEGESKLFSPLDSADTRACMEACKKFGAKITEYSPDWSVTGVGGVPEAPDDVIDVGNSGTTLYLATGLAALQRDLVVFTGDSQIRSRPVGPLLDSLRDLGARAESTRNNGCAPYIVGGGLSGGDTEIECRTSQWLSALLLSAPLARNKSAIVVPLPCLTYACTPIVVRFELFSPLDIPIEFSALQRILLLFWLFRRNSIVGKYQR